jgi:hypothetical protein
MKWVQKISIINYINEMISILKSDLDISCDFDEL